MPDNTAVLLAVSTLSLSAPLILVSLGGLTSERSGVINIALEGKMLTAACCGAVAGLMTGNAFAALAGAIFAGILMSLLHHWLTQSFRMDHIISGMGVNALAIGLTRVMVETMPVFKTTNSVPTLPSWFFVSLAFVCAVGCAFYLKKTKGGLHLFAVGSDPDKSRQMGLDPVRVRFLSLIATGVFCGFAGMLIVGNAGSFSKEMTSGRGFIALAALILGGWRPIPALLACLLFGFVSSLQLVLQGSGSVFSQIPPEFFQAMPYVVTLAAIAVMMQSNKAPAGLGKN